EHRQEPPGRPQAPPARQRRGRRGRRAPGAGQPPARPRHARAAVAAPGNRAGRRRHGGAAARGTAPGHHPARGGRPELRGDRATDAMPDRHRPLAHLPRPRGDRRPPAPPAGQRTSAPMSREYLHDELPVDLREQLCAWMDGELPADQAAFLQRRLAHDPELRALWERWQLASACLRRQPLRLMPADMGECLVVQVQEATAPRRRHWPWAAGLAAAVLLAALLPRMTVMETPPALPESPRMAAEATPLAAPPRGPMSPVNDGPRATEDVLQPRPWPRSPLAPGEREMEA